MFPHRFLYQWRYIHLSFLKRNRKSNNYSARIFLWKLRPIKANKTIASILLSTKDNPGVFNQELFEGGLDGTAYNGWIRIDKYDNGLVHLTFWMYGLKLHEYAEENVDLVTIPYGFQSDQQFLFHLGKDTLWSDANNGRILLNACISSWVQGIVLYHTNQ